MHKKLMSELNLLKLLDNAATKPILAATRNGTPQSGNVFRDAVPL